MLAFEQKLETKAPGRPRVNVQMVFNKSFYKVKLIIYLTAGIAQLVERNLAKVEVASSNLVSRSFTYICIYFNSN